MPEAFRASDSSKESNMESFNPHEYVPRRLDAAAKFLLWDFDLVASGIAGLAFGIIVNSLLMGAIASYAAIWAYSRLKQKRHPGYGLHYLYWQFPFRTFKRPPPSSRRFFVG